jgi:hypothetical protein
MAFPTTPADGAEHTIGTKTWTYTQSTDLWTVNGSGGGGGSGTAGNQPYDGSVWANVGETEIWTGSTTAGNSSITTPVLDFATFGKVTFFYENLTSSGNSANLAVKNLTDSISYQNVTIPGPSWSLSFGVAGTAFTGRTDIQLAYRHSVSNYHGRAYTGGPSVLITPDIYHPYMMSKSKMIGMGTSFAAGGKSQFEWEFSLTVGTFTSNPYAGKITIVGDSKS